MKRLLLVLSMLIIAGSAFAAELKISGDFYVRGSEYSNLDVSDDGNDSTWDRFDYDLNLWSDLVVNEKATVKVKLTYDKNVDEDGKVADGSASADDAGLAVERAYLNYKFAPFLQLNTGLMNGGTWGLTFGDTEINVMRVQFIGALSEDAVFIATYQRDTENATELDDPDDNEKDDKTIYYLASRLKVGPVTILPLFTYVTLGVNYNNEIYDAIYAKTMETLEDAAAAANTSIDDIADGTPGNSVGNAANTADAQATAFAANFDQYDAKVMAFTLALKGDFGMFGFEAEGVVSDMDTDGFYDDAAALGANGQALIVQTGLYDGTTYGLYVDLFAKIDPAKVGFIYAYGSADDEDGAYNWGDDLDLFLVMDDFVSNDAVKEYGLKGFTAYKLYVDATFGAVSVGVSAGMGQNNADTDNACGTTTTKDAKFTEYDASISYAFDANTTYTVAGGYAMTEDWLAKGDEESAYRVYHKMAVKF